MKQLQMWYGGGKSLVTRITVTRITLFPVIDFALYSSNSLKEICSKAIFETLGNS